MILEVKKAITTAMAKVTGLSFAFDLMPTGNVYPYSVMYLDFKNDFMYSGKLQNASLQVNTTVKTRDAATIETLTDLIEKELDGLTISNTVCGTTAFRQIVRKSVISDNKEGQSVMLYTFTVFNA